jgi:hypothetical protein
VGWLVIVAAAVSLTGPAAGGGDPDAGFDRQLRHFVVLRDRLPRDDDPQVRAQVRALRRSSAVKGVRTRYARLLGHARSGSAYVLIPVRRFAEGRRDGLCLFRRGSQGGAGRCLSTHAIRSGLAHDALAAETYGLVPDGVAFVEPRPGDALVRVRRNFYRYASRGTSRVRPPAWYDAGRDRVEKLSP